MNANPSGCSKNNLTSDLTCLSTAAIVSSRILLEDFLSCSSVPSGGASFVSASSSVVSSNSGGWGNRTNSSATRSGRTPALLLPRDQNESVYPRECS